MTRLYKNQVRDWWLPEYVSQDKDDLFWWTSKEEIHELMKEMNDGRKHKK